jgi:putative protease
MVPEESYPLSLKDLSLSRHLGELEAMGVKAVKIEGRMKRPEYVALTARIYSAAIREKRGPTRDELAALEAAFSRQGFTDGYYEDKKGRGMFGVHEPNENAQTERLFAAARASYREGQELQRVGVRFYCLIQEGRPSALAAEDFDGNQALAEGEVAAERLCAPDSRGRGEVRSCTKRAGRPFTARMSACSSTRACPAVFGHKRHAQSVLDELSKNARRYRSANSGNTSRDSSIWRAGNRPSYRFRPARIPDHPAACPTSPALVYVPLDEIDAHPECLKPLGSEGVEAVAALPRVIGDHEGAQVLRCWNGLRALGVKCVLAVTRDISNSPGRANLSCAGISA